MPILKLILSVLSNTHCHQNRSVTRSEVFLKRRNVSLFFHQQRVWNKKMSSHPKFFIVTTKSVEQVQTDVRLWHKTRRMRGPQMGKCSLLTFTSCFKPFCWRSITAFNQRIASLQLKGFFSKAIWNLQDPFCLSVSSNCYSLPESLCYDVQLCKLLYFKQFLLNGLFISLSRNQEKISFVRLLRGIGPIEAKPVRQN